MAHSNLTSMSRTPANAARFPRLITVSRQRLVLRCVLAKPELNELDRAYLGETSFPKYFVGPIKVQTSEGKGRGLFTTQDVAAGDLLLVTQPLAVRYTSTVADEGILEQDDGEDDLLKLQQSLRNKARGPYEQQWMHALFDGTQESKQMMPDLQDLQSMVLQAREGEPNVEVLTPETSSSESDVNLTAIVDMNFFEDVSEDEVMCKLLGTTMRRPVGIWPETSLLNHSCTPNVATYVFQDSMFVRAARPLPAGSELCTNYLGSFLTSPLDVRKALLRDNHNMTCSCERCKTEGSQNTNLRKIINDIYEAVVERLSIDLGEALAMENKKTVGSIKQQLVTYVELLDAAFTKQNLPDKAQIWLQACVFDLYMLLGWAMDVCDEIDPALYALLQGLFTQLAPGSDPHVYWSAMYVQRMQEQYGAKSEEVWEATEAAYEAFSARYGGISRAMLARMLAARLGQEDGLDP